MKSSSESLSLVYDIMTLVGHNQMKFAETTDMPDQLLPSTEPLDSSKERLTEPSSKQSFKEYNIIFRYGNCHTQKVLAQEADKEKHQKKNSRSKKYTFVKHINSEISINDEEMNPPAEGPMHIKTEESMEESKEPKEAKIKYPEDQFYTTIHCKGIANKDANDFPCLKYLNKELYIKLVLFTLKALYLNNDQESVRDLMETIDLSQYGINNQMFYNGYKVYGSG